MMPQGLMIVLPMIRNPWSVRTIQIRLKEYRTVPQ